MATQPGLEASIRFTGVTLLFRVSSLETSMAWYREMFGLQPLRRDKTQGWCELAGAAGNIRIGLRQSDTVTLKGGCVPAWEVEDLEAARRFLEGKKVRFDGPTIELPGLEKLATFYDPDGNSWMLRQDLVRPAGR